MNLVALRVGAVALLILVANALAVPPQTERVYLSGRDKDTAVPWEFMCTSGAQSGYWTNLAVPSHWDLHGFGTLTYKKDATNAWDERGLYRHTFAGDRGWEGRRVFLVFEGVMTDTTAKLNGTVLGPTRRGGFYRFKYDVTEALRLGETNLLEVEVARHSANESVNRAERLADYWVFAGIYRPVYLEIVPEEFIERVAIDARADGTFGMEVHARALNNSSSVEMQILDQAGNPVPDGEQSIVDLVVPPQTGSDGTLSRSKLDFRLRMVNPRLWTAETPNLYTVNVRLKRGDATVHEYSQRFGFRTIEVRDGDGVYVNGERVVLKGVNRHSAWPDSGRCLSEAVHRLDIETMKDMNMNAVRMSHYPPDVGFLDLCDELGLYVLDELAGWHNHYDDDVGPRLVEAMVTRDVNHPSILFWDNGNEGGWNTNLDADFPQWDPQARRVLHPWEPFGGINTGHYLAYSNAMIAAQGRPMYYQWQANDEILNTNQPSGWIYMPTEFLHGLYDGGAGAGLEDYWTMMMSHSNCAGGFLWVFADEGVKRPDTGEIDCAGNQAPDGVVGPYREREGSFYTVKELWSPIQVRRESNGVFTVENHYDFVNANQCRFSWQLERIPWPNEARPVRAVLAEGSIPAPSIPPGGRGAVDIELPANAIEADLLALRVDDPGGRELWTWSWPMPRAEALRALPNLSSRQAHFDNDDGQLVRCVMDGLEVTFSRETGLLEGVERGGVGFSFRNGPRPVTGSFQLTGLETNGVGGDVIVRATYEGALSEVTWRLRSDGWLQCDYEYAASGAQDSFGVTFDYPERLVLAKRWLGDGPYRVWKNRRQGVRFGLWETAYNDTVTGYSQWVYPEFKGCFGNVYWMKLATEEGDITVVRNTPGFIQVLRPAEPPKQLQGHTGFKLPDCGLAFLDAIPPVGSKFKPAATTGPQGAPNLAPAKSRGTMTFWFGPRP